ncbi:hypothetical protein C1Y35_07445 [Pseudomonas sp. GW456-L14]|nr:hypothetical protein C1Y35_07445 [Pseudomonas sp. GW456-L14]PMY54722.1 hypothetical protein C1Y34_16855 [Pseudomonas sp. GW456-L12]
MNFILYAAQFFFVLIVLELLADRWRGNNYRVADALYMDRNYGGVFIIWDRLFGTFQEADDNEPVSSASPRPWPAGTRCGPICSSMPGC